MINFLFMDNDNQADCLHFTTVHIFHVFIVCVTHRAALQYTLISVML